MCGRYSIYESMDHYLKELAPKQLEINGYDLWPIERYNVAPTTRVEIIRPTAGGLSVDKVKWDRPRSGLRAFTPEDAPPELMRLSNALEQAILRFGQDQEHKEFQPHLTLAGDYQSPVPEAGLPSDFFLRSDGFALYESHKGQYRVIAE